MASNRPTNIRTIDDNKVFHCRHTQCLYYSFAGRVLALRHFRSGDNCGRLSPPQSSVSSSPLLLLFSAIRFRLHCFCQMQCILSSTNGWRVDILRAFVRATRWQPNKYGCLLWCMAVCLSIAAGVHHANWNKYNHAIWILLACHDTHYSRSAEITNVYNIRKYSVEQFFFRICREGCDAAGVRLGKACRATTTTEKNKWANAFSSAICCFQSYFNNSNRHNNNNNYRNLCVRFFITNLRHSLKIILSSSISFFWPLNMALRRKSSGTKDYWLFGECKDQRYAKIRCRTLVRLTTGQIKNKNRLCNRWMLNARELCSITELRMQCKRKFDIHNNKSRRKEK